MLDPTDPTSFNQRFVLIPRNGHRYHLVDQAPPSWVGPLHEAPTLLLLHGFPDLWYGWRYQIHDFASRGWRVLCPSQLGYGDSSHPVDVGAYSFKSVAYDMNSVLDACGIKGPVIVVGHDWGGMIAWRLANYFPHRVKALVSVCTPYQKPTAPGIVSIPDEILLKRYLPNFGYQLYFMQASAAKEMDKVVDLFLQPMFSPEFRKKKVMPDEAKMSHWVLEGRLEASIKRQIAAREKGELPVVQREKELDYYVDTYSKGGMTGPLNWYKTRQINFREEQEANLPPFPEHIPVLQIPAALDGALPPSMCLSKAVLSCFPAGNMEVRILEGADHWCLQDINTRVKVTEMMGEWIERVLVGKWKPTGTTQISKI